MFSFQWSLLATVPCFSEPGVGGCEAARDGLHGVVHLLCALAVAAWPGRPAHRLPWLLAAICRGRPQLWGREGESWQAQPGSLAQGVWQEGG